MSDVSYLLRETNPDSQVASQAPCASSPNFKDKDRTKTWAHMTEISHDGRRCQTDYTSGHLPPEGGPVQDEEGEAPNRCQNCHIWYLRPELNLANPSNNSPTSEDALVVLQQFLFTLRRIDVLLRSDFVGW